MPSPVFLLTFANDQTRYLDSLKQESRQVSQALETWVDQQHIRVYREESVTTDSLIHAVNRFDGEIAIFHYAGHAGGEQLDLEDTEAQASGLANLLAKQAGLQLVFLNGCSTYKQVALLLQLGVKAVIATRVSIEDGKAVEFATNFYRKLVNKGSIRQAFEFASDSLSLKYKGLQPATSEGISVTRRMDWGKKEDTVEMPWGLYYSEENPETLNWTIPIAEGPAPTLRSAKASDDFLVNDYIYQVLEDMFEYAPDLEEEAESLEDEREYLDLIIVKFPWNIGSQISILVSNDPQMSNPGLERLKQIVSTYISCIQLVYFSLVSQVWEEQESGVDISAPLDLRDVSSISREDFPTYDYIRHFMQLMEAMTVEPFIPEFRKLHAELSSKGEVYDGYLYLESIRQQLFAETTAQLEAEIAHVCADAEYALYLMLSKLAFLVKYPMVTIRNIQIFHPRHKKPTYRHQMGRLNAQADDRLKLFREPKSYQRFLENSAIFLLKSLDNVESHLSLSPFFVDKNAFGDPDATATDLYSFAYTSVNPDTGEKEYYYLKSSHNIFQTLEKTHNQIHTGIELQADTRRVRFKGRLRNRQKDAAQKPYALLKEIFEDLSN